MRIGKSGEESSTAIVQTIIVIILVVAVGYAAWYIITQMIGRGVP